MRLQYPRARELRLLETEAEELAKAIGELTGEAAAGIG